MGITYDHIPEHIVEWIPKQHMFWVATAPQALDGHINISPKGVAGTFHVVSPSQVWYEDLSGTGAETIAHIRENGRITILFNAFEGPPRIARLYGKGSYHEFGSVEYNRLLPLGTRQPGSRAVIVVDVWKVAATCGYSVPYYTFNGHRVRLLDWAAKREKIDQTETEANSHGEGKQNHPKGMAAWWRDRNMFSLDGLPALSTAFGSTLGIGLHQPVPKTGAPSRQPGQQHFSTPEARGLTNFLKSPSIIDTLLLIWTWFVTAVTAIILSSPIIGYPPLSIQPVDETHAPPQPGHKMDRRRQMVPHSNSILGYAFSFLLGVAFTISLSVMSKPIAGPG